MNFELLEEIGLTKSEIKVYLALLELGSSTTGPIVDKSSASSSKIYEILEKLIQKGLASFVITSGTKYFEAADPYRLLDYMKEKEAKLKQQEEDLSKILPELKLKQTMTKHKSETLVFKGMKGAETAFNDILNTLSKGEEMLVIGFSDVQEQFQRFIVKFHKRRAKAGIKARMIFGESLREMVQELQALPGAKVKLHPPQKGNPVGVLIYADKTLFSLAWDNVWIQIKNQRLADAHREQFEELWNQNTTIAKGKKAMIQSLKNFVSEIASGDTFDALGATFGLKGKKQEFANLFKEYHDFRIKKGIRARLLFQPGAREMYEKNEKNYGNCEARFLPYDTDSPVSIHPYKDKTMMIIQEKNPTIITINNKEITQSFTKHFESLWNQETSVAKGFDAFTRAWSDLLEEIKPGDSYEVYGAAIGIGKDQERYANFFKTFHQRRIEKGIHGKILFQQGAEKTINTFGMGKLYNEDQEIKLLPYKSNFPVEIFPYANKTLLLIQKKEPIVITINNKEVTDSFKNHFDNLWNQETQTFTTKEAIEEAFYYVIDKMESKESVVYGARRDPRFADVLKKHHKMRAAKGIRTRMVMTADCKGEIPDLMEESALCESRFHSDDFNPLLEVGVYGENVLMVSWGEKPVAFLIHNKQVAASHAAYFELLWKQEKE